MNLNDAKNIKIERSAVDNWRYDLLPRHKLPLPMIPLSILTGGHCCFAKKGPVTVLLNESCLAVCRSCRSHCIQVQCPVIYKPVLLSSILSFFSAPTTHHFHSTTILKKYFYSKNLQIFIAIICFHLTMLVSYIIKREILHQA